MQLPVVLCVDSDRVFRFKVYTRNQLEGRDRPQGTGALDLPYPQTLNIYKQADSQFRCSCSATR